MRPYDAVGTMKAQEDQVTELLGKLTLKNNLDLDEEDEIIESVVVVEQKKETQEDEYISKGPIR